MKILILLFKNATSILAVLGILAVLCSLYKIFLPSITLKMASFYYTLDKNGKCLSILKLQTTSNIDLMLKDVTATVTLEDGKTFEFVPFSPRLKATVPVMLDLEGRASSFKLLRPLEPDLRVCGIKQGNNEYYISLKSLETFEDLPIKSWSFRLSWQQHMLPIPNIPWFNQKTVTIKQPEGKDLYFDDLLFQKISAEERARQIDEL